MDAVQSPSHSNVDDEVRHDRLTGHTIEVPLGPLLSQAAITVEEHAETEAERIAAAALALPHTHGAMAIASMTDRLLTRVGGLAAGIEHIPVCRRGVRGVAALAKWQTLQDRGPAPDPLGNWSYMRELAHVAHDMVRVLQDHRAAEQPRGAFVARPGMPPLTPGAP
ncbi:hypothetical protein R1T08_24075 [Streptomyces sp. SBC-4]|nr:hypothetical protein [Streptomyces sp. SBC-4]MDV5147168.1 hypothetical protein [Streptomyces sp. SBC-4]